MQDRAVVDGQEEGERLAFPRVQVLEPHGSGRLEAVAFEAGAYGRPEAGEEGEDPVVQGPPRRRVRGRSYRHQPSLPSVPRVVERGHAAYVRVAQALIDGSGTDRSASSVPQNTRITAMYSRRSGALR
ncbi:hypothetical protein GCM10023238_33030 [Streptomyces heliomycini]